MTDLEGKSFRRLSRRWYLGCLLLDALKYGKLQDVASIVKTPDIDPNIIVPEYGIAPMHCAAGIEPEEFGVKCIQAFLRVGGDANVKCSEGVTPVHVASCWGRLKVLRLLLGSGGDPYLLDNDGKDAFYYAQGSEVFHLLKHHQNNNQTAIENNICPLNNLENDQYHIKAKQPEDLDMNASALSLIMKHRQGILLFEYLPSDEDASSSSTLETEFNEDFSFEPKDMIKVSSELVAIKEEDIRAHSDSEICTEDILSSDMTKVIKVINENINRSKSHLSLQKESFDLAHLSMEKNDQLVCQKWTDNSINEVDESFNAVEDSGSNEINEKIYDNSMNLSSSNFFEPKCSTNRIEGFKEEFKEIGSDHSSCFPSVSRLKEEHLEEESECVKTCDDSLKSDVTNNVTDVTTSLGSPQISASNVQLPKKVREKLLCFKVNTHYKTRIYKLVTRSCDGLTSKKSLYTTGYEFWSTRVKSKSYPCYIGPLKYREKIMQHNCTV